MDLSLIVCAYDMQRELPRTIMTLAPDYQRGIDGLNYEIVVVDNGSPQPVVESELQQITPNVRVVRVGAPSISPVRAVNMALRSASGRLLGLFIDGARMASPGLLRAAIDAHRLDPTKIIGSLAFHLGPDVQMRSVPAGYDQKVEDELLDTVPWRTDGYRLFSISVLAGSSRQGWFGNIAESNGVFFDRAFLQRVGGLDERFATAGGGLANLEFWTRTVHASNSEPWMILGEGTFHQVHGGAATNGSPADRGRMLDEYRDIFGKPFVAPIYRPRFIGSLDTDLAKRFLGEADGPPRKAHSIHGRSFAVGIGPDELDKVQAATLKTRYKGRRLAKNPFDLSLYRQLVERLKPQTIIEIGTSEGGSAIWLRDQCNSLGLPCEILSIDIDNGDRKMDGVTLFSADATRPQETFPHGRISSAAHPWLVIEDSAHTFESTKAVLDYFHPLLEQGDYLVVEDGVVADLREARYRKFDDGPNRAVRDHLLRHPGDYRIDTELCDFYGYNVTYCPNAWLVRT